MPQPAGEHEMLPRGRYQEEEEDEFLDSISDWELAVQGWFEEIMQGVIC